MNIQDLPHTIRVCGVDLADGKYTPVLTKSQGVGGWTKARMYPGCPSHNNREDCLRTYTLQEAVGADG